MVDAPFPADVHFALHEIGSAGKFSRAAARKAAEDFCGALATLPNAGHMIVVGGYDTDPRELWEIPEAKAFVREFAAFVTMILQRPLNEWRLDGPSMGFVAMCAGIGRLKSRDPVTGHWTIEIGVPPA